MDSQVKNGDLICISREFYFIIKWKNTKKRLKCNTNISYYTLRNIICKEFSIPKSDWDKYTLKARGQFIPLEALIPFGGISDEIEVVEIQGRYF